MIKKLLCSMMLIAAANTSMAAVDTGVAKDGSALPSNASFTQDDGVEVTMDNVVRAETAKYFAKEIALNGGNKFRHERKGIDLNNQTVIRSNFDLIYSYGVFDTKGGLTVSVPAYDLYHSVQIFDGDHFTIDVVYPGETKTANQDDLTYGRYVYLFMRTQPRELDSKGIAELNQRQDAVTVTQGNLNPGTYKSEVLYDVASFNTLRDDLVRRGPKEAVIYKGFVAKGDPINVPQYQLVNINGWGGLPAAEAFYWVVAPGDDGSAEAKCSFTTIQPLPVQYDKNGYWSLTAYDASGWVKTDQFRIGSHDAEANADGSYTIHFNCDGAINNIQTTKNWNALMRAYLPNSLDAILNFSEDMTKDHPVVIQQ